MRRSHKFLLLAWLLVASSFVVPQANAFMANFGYWQQAISKLANLVYGFGQNLNGALGNNTTTITRTVTLTSGGYTNWDKVATGTSHSCGIRNGIAYCWGLGTNGRLGTGGSTVYVPTLVSGSYTDWSKISTGAATTCAIRSGLAYCWGSNTAGAVGSNNPTTTTPTIVNDGYTDWTDISTRADHSCGLRGGQIFCWGTSDSGEVGNGILGTDLFHPTQEANGWTDWTKVSAGDASTCAIRAGTAYCWGAAGSGRLGNGLTTPNRTTPTLVLGGWTDWTDISAGSDSACGIRGSLAYCWGSGANGKLGNGSTSSVTSPSLVLGGYTDWTNIYTGNNYACGLRNGAAYCWGSDVYGGLGDNAIPASTPTLVLGGFTNWTKITASINTSCGIVNGGQSYCWGSGAYYNIGNNSFASRVTPSLVSGGWTDWTDLSASVMGACGIRNGGVAYCWGYATGGRIGDGQTSTNRATPTLVLGGFTNWSKLSSTETNTCGIRGGLLYCWGQASNGIVGDGQTASNRTTPTLVLGGFSNWTTVSAGPNSACGLVSGTAYCWGVANFGRLGNGVSTGTYSSPSLVLGGFTDWTKIATGSSNVCGIRGGATYCWGSAINGTVGDGQTASDRTSPSLVLGGWTDWTDISVGSSSACGIRSGIAYCWGTSNNGRLGNGVIATVSYSSPTLVLGGFTDWTSIAVASGGSGNTATHACGIRSNSSNPIAYCWGSADISTNRGEIGNSTTLQIMTPIPVSWPTYVSVTALAVGSGYNTLAITTPTTP